MAAHAVPVIDLHAYTTKLAADQGEAKVIRPDKVHFTPSASEAQGKFIAEQLTRVIQKNTQ